jgi:predicted metalloprotease with PDZ domain
MMRATLAALALFWATLAHADVEYRVDLADRAVHRATVEMIVRNAPAPLELAMPVWTPGAYELRNWGRNVMPLDATDGSGRKLAFARTGPSTLRVDGHAAGGEVRLRYRVYEPLLSDDGTQIDVGHAYLNGSSMFLQARGQEKARHRVHVDVPHGWRLASALDEMPSGDGEALGYEALIDAPIEVGRFVDAELRAAGRSYRVVVDGANQIPAGFLRDVAAIAEAEARAAGTPPYRRYLLLVHLADGIGRLAALEHAASTSVVVPRRSLEAGTDAYDELLYVVAHELFHAWNARRLRPAELVPYDLSRPQPARSLWITEGLTEYYAHRAMYQSGRWSRVRYLDRVGDESLRAVAAGRQGLTLEEAAELAWQAPDEASGDPDAYYARGHLVALALDATVRAATDGKKSLDDVMRAMLQAADRGGGVLPVDGEVLARFVRTVAGDAAAQSVIAWTREPNEPARLDGALASLGLKLLVTEGSERTVAGFAAEPDGSGLRIASVRPDGPAAHAGLRAGDRIVSMDGASPAKRWADQVATHAPTVALLVEAMRATRRLSLELHLQTERALTCRLVEAVATPRVSNLREAWLKR